MALTKITTKLIEDSTITNADISASFVSGISGSFTQDMTLATASIAAITSSVSTINSNMTLATASIAAITASLGQPVNTDSNVQFADITSTGTITAVEVHTTFVSSSIAIASGSNTFGSPGANNPEIIQATAIARIVAEALKFFLFIIV